MGVPLFNEPNYCGKVECEADCKNCFSMIYVMIITINTIITILAAITVISIFTVLLLRLSQALERLNILGAMHNRPVKDQKLS